MSLSEIITLLLFCFGFFEKKGCTPKRVFFTFLPVRAYKLHSTFSFTRWPPRWSVRTSKDRSGASIINYNKEEMIKRQKKSESKLTSYIVLWKCSRLRWYKWVFPGSFFSLNKALFLFFSCFFWGERIPFYLTTTECRWNIGNAGEVKLKFSCGWESRNAGDTRTMRVSSHICISQGIYI